MTLVKSFIALLIVVLAGCLIATGNFSIGETIVVAAVALIMYLIITTFVKAAVFGIVAIAVFALATEDGVDNVITNMEKIKKKTPELQHIITGATSQTKMNNEKVFDYMSEVANKNMDHIEENARKNIEEVERAFKGWTIDSSKE